MGEGNGGWQREGIRVVNTASESSWMRMAARSAKMLRLFGWALREDWQREAVDELGLRLTTW